MKIRHVYGNVLKLDIPLTIKIRTIEDGTASEREEPFYPDVTQGCIVELANNYNRKIEYEATIKDNIVHIEDIGKISIGRYKITVKCYDADGNPYRYMARDIVEICDATADAGIEAGVEFNAETYTLEGAVFISYGSGSFEQVQSDWTENDIHSKAYIKNKPTIPEEQLQADFNQTNQSAKDFIKNKPNMAAIQQWLAQTVCGGEYNSTLKRLEFKDNDNTLLFSIDATAFIKDGMVTNVAIVNGNLVITFNTDSGQEPISIPITDIFNPNNYYTKNDIDLTFATITSIADMATKTWVNNQVSGKEDKVDILSASGTTLTAEVGKYYTLSNVGTLAITLPTIAAGTTKVQTVTFYVAAGSTPAVTFTSTHSIYYSDGFEIAANSTYEVSAAYNGIAWVVASVKIVIPT